MFTFYIENHELFGPLTKNCPKLDKNKSVVSRFLVFVVYKLAVSTVQKSNYVVCFNFVSECLYLHIYISWYFNKIDQIAFSELEKSFLHRFRSFSLKWLRRYQETIVPNGMKTENSLDIF